MQTDFPHEDFDDWAENYDKSVSSQQRFPLINYDELLGRITALAAPRPGLTVLDLGTGTGNLVLPFARSGCELWCTDFSEPMLARARKKLPRGHFFLYDLRTPLPPELDGPFDRILSAFVFHHFGLAEKIRILKALLPHLAPGGSMLIGDVAFPDAPAMEKARLEAGDAWEEEYYWLADESLDALEKAGLSARYELVSGCAGIFILPGAHGGTGG
jgi:putative AdoMet-dependent methyltransferase